MFLSPRLASGLRFDRLPVVVFFSGLFVFHLATLGISSRSSPIFDEVAMADYAYHGESSLWRQIIPRAHKNLLYTYPGSLVWSGHTQAQGWIMRRIGVGVIQSKIGGALAGLLGLVIIALLVRSLGYPWFFQIGLLLFGFSGPFFNLTHSCRPEGYVFLAMALNWHWFFIGRGRIWSLAVGCLASAAFAFHPAAVFLLMPIALMLAIQRVPPVDWSKRCWWLIGACVGGIYVLNVLEVERGIQFLKFAGALQTPPLLRLFSDPLFILKYAFFYFYTAGKQGYGWHFLFSGMCFLAALQIIHYRSLPAAARRLLEISLLTALSLCLLQASGNGVYYIVYAVPWLILSFLAGADLLLQRKIEIRFADQIAFALIVLLAVSVFLKQFSYLAWISFVFCLLHNLTLWSRTRIGVLVCSALLGLLAVYSESTLINFMSTIGYLLEFRPSVLCALVILPWVLLAREQVSILGRVVALPPFSRLFLGLCVLSVVAMGLLQFQWVSTQKNIDRHTAEDDLKMLTLLKYRRLVAPDELWFFQPSIPFQSTFALSRLAAVGNIAEALIDYKPDYVLWPVGERYQLEKHFSKLRQTKLELEWGAVWHMQYRDWIEVKLTPIVRRPGLAQGR